MVHELSLAGFSAGNSWTNPRVAVLWWHQRVLEGDEFMQIAYDAPLVGEGADVVPLDMLQAPYEENLVCERSCRQRETCPCVGAPAIALGTIVVAQDTNGDGMLSLEEIEKEQLGGVGSVLVGWSQTESEHTPRGWDGYFDSIALGICPYRYDRMSSVALLLPVTGVSGNLAVEAAACAASATDCTFAVPEVFCLWGRCAEGRGLNRFGIGPSVR
jgi:hypothetical protein